jgi:hypothetical protein
MVADALTAGNFRVFSAASKLAESELATPKVLGV